MEATRIPLSDLSDHEELPIGTRFRQYGIGLNVDHPDKDYYEYMLVHNVSEPEYVLLACVEGPKSGSVLALVKAAPGTPYAVTGAAIKDSMGTENTYVLS